MEQTYTKKEILGDALCTQKAATGQFNMAANECVHEDVRQTIQQDVFKAMHDAGYYPTPDADASKVMEAKQQFCKSSGMSCC